MRWAQHNRMIWTRLLFLIGLFTLILFGLVAALAHRDWAWGAAAVLTVSCWWPAVHLGWQRRRAATGLRRESEDRATQHAAEVARYEQAKAQWSESEAERVATAPRWLQVAAAEDVSRLDVFGGTAAGRRGMLTGVGWELLGQRAVIVLDLSQERVADGLIAAADQAGLSYRDYELPADLTVTPLLDGLTGDEIASLIVEVVHADDANATAAGRATDLMALKKVVRVLGDDVTMGRLHAALEFLLDEGAPGTDGGDGLLTGEERSALHKLFGDGMRGQLAGILVRLAAVVEPLAGLGTAAPPRSAARLTCLSLADGARDVAADLTAALVVQWVTRAVAAGDGFRPAVVLAGADEQSTRHLSRLTAVCERYEVPLVRTFSRLTEESARHLDTRQTAFMRLATRPEALRAAEHIGLERRFVAGRFSRTHSLSQSRTHTTSESVTQTSGSTQGESVTHTTGNTTGQGYSEAAVPRRDQRVHVHVNGSAGQRATADEDEESKRGTAGDGKDKGGENGNQAPQVRNSPGRWPGADIVKTRMTFSAQHESEARTGSWTKTEETSHTRSTEQSYTVGVSVGDEISFELVYDHRVQPETLMSLPEDQMLAPHVTERVTGATARAPLADGKLVALVIDPAVVGSAAVAPVRPDEIPAFEPPAPAVSGHVPDYERVPRPAVTAG